MASAQLIGHDVFQLLRPDQLRAIIETAEEVLPKAGDTVVQRGDKADHSFTALEGQVALRLPVREKGTRLITDRVTMSRSRDKEIAS